MGTDSIARKTDSSKSDKPRYHVDPEGYGVTEPIEKHIRALAWRIASEHGDYGEIDDLAQEGRIAAWQTAIAEGPREDYCAVSSKQAMSHYARTGKSIDGRVWPAYRRSKVYNIEELDAPLPLDQAPEGTTLGDALPDPRHHTEPLAFSAIALDEIEHLLNDEELEVARLKAAGFGYREMAGLGLFSYTEVQQLSKNIRKKLAWYFDRDDLRPAPRKRWVAERFRWEPPQK